MRKNRDDSTNANGIQDEFKIAAKRERCCIFFTFFQKLIFKIALLIISVVFIIIGVARGEVAVVLQKAVRICMECIGLG